MSKDIIQKKTILKNDSQFDGGAKTQFEGGHLTNQISKYLLGSKEFEENTDYNYDLIKNEKFIKEKTSELKENLKQLKEQKIINKAIKKEEHKKLIEEMNLKTEKESKNTNNKKRLIINNNQLTKESINKKEDNKTSSISKIKQVSVNNVEIPEGTHTWRNQKLARIDTIFIDDLFPPTKNSLCKLNKLGIWELPEDVDEVDVQDWEKINWKRVEDIFESSNYQVFYDKIEKDDIIQGSLGNCYFLSALASLCKYPNLIEKLFFFKEKSNEHCYGCYFRINGIWKLVLLDDFIPCYSNNYENNFAFSYTNGNELWVILLEKAWAKLNGNYARIIGGDPHEIYEVLTNAYSEKFMFNDVTEEEIWLKYKKAQEKGFLMTAGTNCDEKLPLEEMGLVPGHAYTIIKVLEIITNEGKQKLVNLRNPWGHKEWSGDWSDSSLKWTKEIRKQCNNYDIKNDGSFWMSFEDFYKYFIIGGICHIYQDYHYSFLHIFKESSVKGAFLSKLVIHTNDTHCFLMVHQKNPRVILRDGQYQIPVLFYLMLIDSNFEYISSNYGQEKNIKIEVTLNKGIYYMISDINYRYVQKEQHGYTLSCYSSNPVEINVEKKLTAKTAFPSSLFSYSKRNIIPKKNKGCLIYKYKKMNKDFPFSFVLFDNIKGKKEISISDSIKIKENKNFTYYFEKENNANFGISKIIYPGSWDIFCCMPYKLGDSYSIQLKTIFKEVNTLKMKKQPVVSFIELKTIINDDKLYNDIFHEEWEALDDKSLIRQYIHIPNQNYYLGIENLSDKKVNITLNLKYIKELNKQDLIKFDFDIPSKNRKIFLLKYKDNFIGETTFNIEFLYE